MKLTINSNDELLALVQRVLPLITEVETHFDAEYTVPEDIAKTWADGNKLEAIKLHRTRYGLNLLETKTLLEKNYSRFYP